MHALKNRQCNQRSLSFRKSAKAGAKMIVARGWNNQLSLRRCSGSSHHDQSSRGSCTVAVKSSKTEMKSTGCEQNQPAPVRVGLQGSEFSELRLISCCEMCPKLQRFCKWKAKECCLQFGEALRGLMCPFRFKAVILANAKSYAATCR